MTIRVFVPHSFDVYKQDQFVNLELVKGSYIADGVEGDPIFSAESEGSIRMPPTTESLGVDSNGVAAYKTVYGEPQGFPTDLVEGDIVITSLPVVSNMNAVGHPMASFVASPYNVVRLRSNTSTVLGCMGYTH